MLKSYITLVSSENHKSYSLLLFHQLPLPTWVFQSISKEKSYNHVISQLYRLVVSVQLTLSDVQRRTGLLQNIFLQNKKTLKIPKLKYLWKREKIGVYSTYSYLSFFPGALIIKPFKSGPLTITGCLKSLHSKSNLELY